MTQHRNTLEDHYRYIDMNDYYWDAGIGHWRPKGTEGDRCVLPLPPSPPDCLHAHELWLYMWLQAHTEFYQMLLEERL